MKSIETNVHCHTTYYTFLIPSSFAVNEKKKVFLWKLVKPFNSLTTLEVPNRDFSTRKSRFRRFLVFLSVRQEAVQK